MKNHKIIENINFFREQEKRKSELTLSQVNGLDKSKVYNDHFEVSRVLVDLKDTKHPNELRMHRSLSCSYKALESSRMSVIEGLKSGESLFQSMVKQEGPLFSSRVIEVKKPQTNVNLAESQYFAGIIGKWLPHCTLTAVIFCIFLLLISFEVIGFVKEDIQKRNNLKNIREKTWTNFNK